MLSRQSMYLMIGSSLMLALLGAAMARNYEMARCSAAQFILWSQPDLAERYQAAPLQIDDDAHYGAEDGCRTRNAEYVWPCLFRHVGCTLAPHT